MKSTLHYPPIVRAASPVHLMQFVGRGRFFGIVALVSVCSFWQSPVFLTSILFVLSCIVLISKRNQQDFVIFLTCGALGALAEIFVVAFGAWSYSLPQFLG